MTKTQTTAEAAHTLHLTPHTIAAWCRTGRIAATKQHGRWAIAASAIARLIRPATDRPRAGQHAPALTGRAARRQAARIEARATAKQYGTRVIGHVQRARIAAANTGHILARDFLADLGFDAAFIGKYESWMGRKTAEAYRANHGTEPKAGGLVVVRGRIFRVNRYTDRRDLENGARAYARTRHLFTDTILAA